MFHNICSLNDHGDDTKQYGYLNPSLICQSSLNPTLNKDDSKYITRRGKKKKFNKKLFEEELRNLKADKKSQAALYIAKCMFRWKDREVVAGAYNFK